MRINTKRKQETETVLLGYVGVDSGQIILTDPCYLDSWVSDEEYDSLNHPGEYSYNGACYATIHEENMGGQLDEGVTAVAVRSGYGDGSYPVYAEISDEGMFGKRVKRLIVEFIPDEEED